MAQPARQTKLSMTLCIWWMPSHLSFCLPACLPACLLLFPPAWGPPPPVCLLGNPCPVLVGWARFTCCRLSVSSFDAIRLLLLRCLFVDVCVCVCVCVCSPSRECQGEAHEPCDCDVWKLWLQKVSEMRPQEREYTTAVWFSTNVVHRLSARIERSSERLKDGDSLRGR